MRTLGGRNEDLLTERPTLGIPRLWHNAQADLLVNSRSAVRICVSAPALFPVQNRRYRLRISSSASATTLNAGLTERVPAHRTRGPREPGASCIPPRVSHLRGGDARGGPGDRRDPGRGPDDAALSAAPAGTLDALLGKADQELNLRRSLREASRRLARRSRRVAASADPTPATHDPGRSGTVAGCETGLLLTGPR